MKAHVHILDMLLCSSTAPQVRSEFNIFIYEYLYLRKAFTSSRHVFSVLKQPLKLVLIFQHCLYSSSYIKHAQVLDMLLCSI